MESKSKIGIRLWNRKKESDCGIKILKVEWEYFMWNHNRQEESECECGNGILKMELECGIGESYVIGIRIHKKYIYMQLHIYGCFYVGIYESST